ncbi:hypothetical protein [Chitinophaga sp. HK235]|uniref:hypothetical protein n=1 Tax=Chitinophaga sp. HK235 TaxID=2952571 RepID=UPI001BAE0464|nr:hypothetical protein [Chitinophaga sp. HK235]
MKVWTNPLKGEDKIIAHIDDMIYKCNPKETDVDQVARGLEMNIIPEKDIFGIPLHYINEIRWQEGKKYIQVFFRGSEEYLTIYDDAKRNEIFNYFKTILPAFSYTTERQTGIQAGKKPLIALVLTGVLLLVALFFANRIEAGVNFEFGNRAGLLTAVIGVASLGTSKVLLIFGSLSAIAGISFVRKAKRPPVYHRIIKMRK